MSNQESWRDVGTCLGAVLGLFLGGMFGFALGMKFIVDRVAQENVPIGSNQTFLAFLGVMVIACLGAAVGAPLGRFVIIVWVKVFSSRR